MGAKTFAAVVSVVVVAGGAVVVCDGRLIPTVARMRWIDGSTWSSVFLTIQLAAASAPFAPEPATSCAFVNAAMILSRMRCSFSAATCCGVFMAAGAGAGGVGVTGAVVTGVAGFGAERAGATGAGVTGRAGVAPRSTAVLATPAPDVLRMAAGRAARARRAWRAAAAWARTRSSGALGRVGTPAGGVLVVAAALRGAG